MIDIDPPHAAVHSWKDFLIHMAAICLGLLIAIGLDQGVEALHHRRQLHELRASLQQDGKQAIRNSERVNQYEDANVKWLTLRATQVREALHDHHPLASLPPFHGPDFDIPDDSAWKAAQASGLLALVPQNDIRAYSELDIVDNHVAMGFDDAVAAKNRRREFEWRFSTTQTPGVADFSTASPEDLQKYLDLLLEELGASRYLQGVNARFHGGELALLRGERNLAAVQESERYFDGRPGGKLRADR